MIETGQVSRMYKKWTIEQGTDCHPRETHPLAMQNVFLIFIFIGLALVVSLVILVFELLFLAFRPTTAYLDEPGEMDGSTSGTGRKYLEDVIQEVHVRIRVKELDEVEDENIN